MISLKPNLEFPPHSCPNCHSALAAIDFVISGMRNLAEFTCPNCGEEYYGDLPAGQGLYTPILLDKKTGEVFHASNADWFAESLSDSYQKRSSEKLGFETRKFSDTKERIVLLNCLDVLYGHSLLKLLNAQYYIDRRTDVSLIILLPKFLEWLLPEDAAEAWIVDLPLRRGTEWNDWLANEIKGRLASFSEVFLSVAFSHPHSSDFDVERFTGVRPLPIENFGRHQNKPAVTFIWREDRLWEDLNQPATNAGKIKRRLGFAGPPLAEQHNKVIEFAGALRAHYPLLDFAVAGLGEAKGFPAWISDLRLEKLDAEAERRWCERYAASHLVVGVHGSNMLLPSAHAGGVIELIGTERAGNFLQDILFRLSDAREMFFRYRFVEPSTGPAELANLALIMLRYEEFRRLMSPEFCRHRLQYDLEDFQSKAADPFNF